MVLSIVGAVVLGGVLAFVSSHITKENHFQVGDATWGVTYQAQPDGIIGPAGQSLMVGSGGIINDVGSTLALAVNPDPAVTKVHFTNVSQAEGGNGTCTTTAFSGVVNVVGTNPVLPGDGLSLAQLPTGSTPTAGYSDGDIPAGLFDVIVTNNDTAGACFGATVGYDVIVGVTVTGAASAGDGTFTAPAAEPPAPSTNQVASCQAAGGILTATYSAGPEPIVFTGYVCNEP